ncbi:MAG: hypothetical protein IPM36_08645 [Lewinellaceae bacterium]|nr:hypothetical protein [Lewinellaceae bacterium]
MSLVFAAFSCRSEKVTPPGPDKQLLISGCDIGMAYDAETTTQIMPANPADIAQLSTLDRALMLPQRERRMESVCVMQDGTYTIETELMEPTRPIEYPERTVGLWPKPAYKRMVNANGVITYYNGENEQIGNEVIDDRSSLALAVVQMFQEMESNPVPSDQVFTNYIDALSANGLPHTAQSSNIYTAQVNNPDGTSSVMVVDKNARMKVGQIDFDTEGHPCTLYMLKVEGQAPNVTFKQMTQVIYFNAVDSEVRMKIQKTTVFDTFSLQL